MAVISRDLGPVTAYAAAVNRGYTGTREEFETLMASYATVAQEAGESASAAADSASDAESSASAAATSANNASSFASAAGTSASNASSAATAAGIAQTAAESARNAAQSAQTAAEAAQEGAETAVEGFDTAVTRAISDVNAAGTNQKELAKRQAEKSEAWAVGQISGEDVGVSDPAYHNNAKYYAEQTAASSQQIIDDAAAEKAAAQIARQGAEAAKDDATDAKTAAEAAQAAAEAAAEQAEGAIEVDDTLSVEGRAADAKAVGDLKKDVGSVEDCLLTEPVSYTKTNHYYIYTNPTFDINKKYKIGITVDSTGTYTIKTGTAGSMENMYDTLFNNETFEAGITKYITYTPSRDSIRVIRLSSNSVEWSVFVSELIDVDVLIKEIDNKFADKVENVDFNLVKRIQKGINLSICTIGDDLPVYSTVSGYKVVQGGHVASASGYSIKKYTVTENSLLYINAVRSTEENNCFVSFRTNDNSTDVGIVEKWVDGMNQIMIVPSGATYMYISTLTTNPGIVKEVSVVVPQEIMDGTITYSMLNNFLQGKIDLIGSVTTETGVGAFHSASDIAEYGSELLDDTGWSGEGWTGDFENGFVSSSGAEALEREIEDFVPGALYRFTITTSNAKTNGYSDFYVSLGGSAEFETYRGGGASISYTFGLVAGSEDNVLKITPSEYTGTITNLSLKQVLNAQLPALVISDTSETKTADIITGLNNLNSIYFGRSSGQKAFFGKANTAVGVNALKSVTDGFWNVAVGMNSLADNINGTRNVAIGYIALQQCITGDRNVAIGSFALNALTKGRGNIAIGADAVQSGNSSYSIGIGVGANGAGKLETIAIGHRAGNSSGQKNTIIGGSAMESAGSAEFCVAVGYQSGKNATGKYNTAFGSFSGYKTTGNYNIAIGYYAGNGATSGNNNIVIGNNAQKDSPTDSNTTVIGNSDITKTKVYGDFIVQGTDGIKRKIIFNQDGTCSWEEAT